MSTEKKRLGRAHSGIPVPVSQSESCEGFTLVESLMAILILTLGLMAAGQMMVVSLSGPALARSKGSAVSVAQNQLDFLTNEYRQNANGPDLTVGSSYSTQVTVSDASTSNTLNRFNVAWTVSAVPDPRAGYVTQSKEITLTVTPLQSTGSSTNIKSGMNKVITVSTILSQRWGG